MDGATHRAEVERLLEASMDRRGHRLPRRELAVEAGLAGLFALGVAALLLLPGPALQADGVVLAVVVAFAIASRVDYPIATGYAVPTQLFLVVLFAYADARLVPLLVVAGLTLGTAGAVLAGKTPANRFAFCAADAMYVLGPAAVLTLTGHQDATTASWPLLVAAFGAQLVVEFASSAVRDRLVRGVRTDVQARVMLQVAGVDAALTPLGIMAVAASGSITWAPVMLLPLVALTAHIARDRLERTERLNARLLALDRERRRLRVAVRRIGDAFASNLDLEALVAIVSSAAVEALDAGAGRGRVVRGAGLAPRAAPPVDPALELLLDRAERGALASGLPTDAHDGDAWARAIPLCPQGSAVAVVSVARVGGAPDVEESALLGYLCTQAAVAAGNVVRHERLHEQALTDDLTGLANHRRLQELLGAAVAAGPRPGGDLALILLDLDDFKLINDAHGHQVGDVVLRAVGQCLRTHCGPGEEPARYGGEELAVVMPATDLDGARALAERLRREIAALAVPGPAGPIRVTVSVGITLLGAGTASKADLIAAADAALYEAKAGGKDRCCVAVPRAGLPSGVAELRAQVRDGLQGEQFVLFYQPKVALADGALAGAEALLRWRHPGHGLLGPARFLSDVEGTELMPELTRWVLAHAARQAVAWRDEGLVLPVAVNISAQDLADPTLADTVARILHAERARPEDLRIEVTEHMAMADTERARTTLLELRAVGVGLSLDDFGSGHSSLTRLRDLPVDELKLDRGLLRAAGLSADAAVTRAAIGLGRDLGLTVIAEGVEDPEVLAELTAMGCDLVQGFCVAPPLLPQELVRWAAGRSGETLPLL